MDTVYSHLEEVVASRSVNAVIFATVVIIALAIISLLWKKPNALVKKILFWSIFAVTILTTFYLGSVTIYLNNVSSSKGPVHWHADFEIWNCGQEIDLLNPKGLSNKIGTPTLHEHNDKRIHLEGVVVDPHDASLGKFFKVIDGQLTSDLLIVPTDQGKVSMVNGQKCADGQSAELQVFAFHVNKEDNSYSQEKLADPASFIIAPESGVPPGDCLILEFDAPKERTDRLCRSFIVAKEIKKLGEEKQ